MTTLNFNIFQLYDWKVWLLLLLLIPITVVAMILERKRRAELEEGIPISEALKRGEGQNIEFKEGIPDRPLANAIAAFANTNHGTIFLGINDAGKVVGLSVSTTKEKDELLQRIRCLTADTIKPVILPKCKFIEHEGKIVLQIVVTHVLKPLHMVDGVIYVRHLNSVTKASPEHVRKMFRDYERERSS
jgi:predicted HTH transcriptional regulator